LDTGGRPIQYWNFRDRGWVPALEAAGLAGKGITIHDLRSAGISLYAANGRSLVEVAAIVGHSDATVTAKTTRACSIAPTWQPASVPPRWRRRSIRDHFRFAGSPLHSATASIYGRLDKTRRVALAGQKQALRLGD
jgi:hypothetical protein